MTRGARGLVNHLVAETCGAAGLAADGAIEGAAAGSTSHVHDVYESAIYTVSGETEVWHGEGLRHRVVVTAADFPVRPTGHPAPAGESQRGHHGGRGRPHRSQGAGERGHPQPAPAPGRPRRLPCGRRVKPGRRQDAHLSSVGARDGCGDRAGRRSRSAGVSFCPAAPAITAQRRTAILLTLAVQNPSVHGGADGTRWRGGRSHSRLPSRGRLAPGDLRRLLTLNLDED